MSCAGKGAKSESRMLVGVVTRIDLLNYIMEGDKVARTHTHAHAHVQSQPPVARTLQGKIDLGMRMCLVFALAEGFFFVFSCACFLPLLTCVGRMGVFVVIHLLLKRRRLLRPPLPCRRPGSKRSAR